MVNEEKRLLKVFLCHASGDKPPVRELYKHLVTEGVDAWLDQEKLLPGQDWHLEIPRAVQEADVVVVCLSKKSITKEGYVQKEIKFALDSAEEKPEGTIFLIPARLEDCAVPERLSRWQWVDLYEENGFPKLLRSLKLRANKVGAVIEVDSYQESDKELQRKLDQVYTDGLAAFYTEDWDKACFCFQAILSAQPNHRNATEKLAEADCQRKLAKLYAHATEAIQAENWHVAIQTLEELLPKSADYKDAAQLLRGARRREQLQALYAEAQALHAAQKWQAVVKVFQQISIIEPNYPDTEGLLGSAEREVAEADRLARLNEQYGQALRAMDAGNWLEARRLLETVHKSQTGFLETEKLLRKVENEILKEEEKRQRDEQIDTLYEQAHGLLRASKWRKALDKLDEIQTLDEEFADPDRIAEKAQKELEVEEQEADRQNHLATLYAEAVKLLKEEKYQDALEKWQEVRVLDATYPDRQRVQSIARRRLSEVNKLGRSERDRLTRRMKIMAAVSMLGIVGLILMVAAPQSFTQFIPGLLKPSPTPRTEFPIQMRIITSSDWTEVKLVSGGRFEDTKKISYSFESSVNTFDSTAFYLNQPLGRANGVNTVEMVVTATLTNMKPGTLLVLEGERGCIGETTIELYNAIVAPILVETLTWGKDCLGGNLRRFEIPVNLFVEELDRSALTQSPKASAVPAPFTKYIWSFDNDAQGWGRHPDDHNISLLNIADGLLVFDITGNDPYIHSPSNLRINALETPVITLRMRVVEGRADQGAIYFITNRDGNYGENKIKLFPVSQDSGSLQTIDIDMSKVSRWRDTVTAFRLDPVNDEKLALSNVQVLIDDISVHAP